jgi:hypothetical protein
MKKSFSLKGEEKGQALVELALVVTVVFIILAGVVDLGSMLFQQLAMRDAAEEGAAYASVFPAACNQTVARVRESLHNPDPDQVGVIITVNGAACGAAAAMDYCPPNEVVVTISQPEFPITMPFMSVILGRQSINLTANVSSTIIRPCQH